MEERKLVQKLKQGDRLALNRAVGTYTPYLSAVVWRTMGPAATTQDVEEVVSDVFLALWSHRDSLTAEHGLKPWLAATARHKAIDRLRTAPPPPLPLDETIPEPREGPEADLERRLFAAALRQAVEALEPPDDQLILRFYYEGDRLKDVADQLGLSVPAAKTRLHRARKKLREVLLKGGLVHGADG